jgi:hypothetical protein
MFVDMALAIINESLHQIAWTPALQKAVDIVPDEPLAVTQLIR